MTQGRLLEEVNKGNELLLEQIKEIIKNENIKNEIILDCDVYRIKNLAHLLQGIKTNKQEKI